MTTEVLVYNADAVAVAADSAMTIGDKRVWEFGNKVFSLGPNHTLGIMYFNNADVGGIPLESIIKVFKRANSNKRFKTVSSLRAEFRKFVANYCKKSIQNPEELAISLGIGLLNQYFLELIDLDEMERVDHPIVTPRSIEAFFEARPSKISEPELIKFGEAHSELVSEYLKAALSEELPDIEIAKGVDLGALFAHLITLKTPSDLYTGLVFFGFGEDEVFPCVSAAIIDGITPAWVRWWDTTNHAPKKAGDQLSGMFSFAQSDMVRLFMRGALEFTEEIIHELAEEYMDENSADDLMKDLQIIQVNKITNPILDAIETLPKEELAIIAESLVDLTSLRRKIDSDVRSVGGPVDVAVVSKGDGFIWMKRKHYFEASLNPDFMNRKRQ